MPDALSEKQIEYIKHGLTFIEKADEDFLTTFYDKMIVENPSLLDLFNRSHNKSLMHPKALAHAIIMFARNIDNLDKFKEILERATQLHASLLVQPGHYPVVGEYLIKTLRAKLDPEVATEEFLDAWALAYQHMAELFIETEKQIYKENKEVNGGWYGHRWFVVASKVRESHNTVSVRLKPKDGGTVIIPQPGQNLGVRFRLPGHVECRQFTISEAMTNGLRGYRITVRRTTKDNVTQFIHDKLKLGDCIEVTPPFGSYTLKPFYPNQRNCLFITGGIGVTPAVSMVKQAIDCGVKTTFVHCDRDKFDIVFRKYFKALAEEYDNFHHEIYFGSQKRFSQRDLIRLVNDTPTDIYVSGSHNFIGQMSQLTKSLSDHHKRYYCSFSPVSQEIS